LDLGQLFQQYLARQAGAQAEGLGLFEREGEVVPYEAAPVQPSDPQQAWHDARAAADFLSRQKKPVVWEVPAEWPALVAGLEPAVALPFCLGSFPQQVRSLQPLLTARDLTALRPTASRPLAVPDLVAWAQGQRSFPQVLMAAGVLRLARHFEEAAGLLAAARPVPSSWQALHSNETVALAWQQGKAEEALAGWQAQADSVPVLFNRGMAQLFLGDAVAARSSLTTAVEQLPESNAWHHLGQLYLTLANR
jgi:hypothetical protein